MNDRSEYFHKGQVWSTPRGFLLKVIESNRGGQAILRYGSDGHGRIMRRQWDAVIGWTLEEDAE